VGECRGKVVQVGTPEELQRCPATPFVLDFIEDVNHLPSNCQFVKRMGFKTPKPHVMCRPTVFEVRQ
jgi:sulfate transport system ATP-binding protein